ncbi:MAG: biotin/lipoyl-binding protein [Patescibacteria group bacterium]
MNMIKKLFGFVREHKITAIILLIALALGTYYIYTHYGATPAETSYETTTVREGSIETLVSTSGQVADDNQINIMPDVSGEILKIAVSEGDSVKTGDLIAQIDSASLESQIYQAQLAVETAQINFNKLNASADDSDIYKAKQSITSSENDLVKLKLTQEDEMNVALKEKQTAKDNLNDLKKSDPDYKTKKATYNDALDSAKRKIEKLNITQPMDIDAAESRIEETKQALAKLQAPPTADELRSQKINLQDQQSKLDDLISQRNDYLVTAPKDGIVAIINYQVGEKISAGGSASSSTALAVMISQNKNTVVAINEVDIPSITAGQKVNLTFDALPDLTMTGTVSKVDLIGTITQNVVSNNVTINFDDQDERLRNGMTVNADIITTSKENILVLSSGAIKTSGQGSYIQTLDQNNSVRMVDVETGISDDVNTEIISGLNSGDIVITKIITPDSTNTNTSSNTNSSGQRSSGSILNMGGGGMMRD